MMKKWKAILKAAARVIRRVLYHCSLMAVIAGAVGLLDVGWRQFARVSGLPLDGLLAAVLAAGLAWWAVDTLRQRCRPKKEATQHDA